MDSLAIVFDMDGLMLDTERMARVAWTRALAENGYQLESSSYLRLVGRTVQAAREVLTEMFGADIPFDKVYQERSAYYDLDIEQNGIPLKPGLPELLRFLEERQIIKCVGSSTPSWFAKRKLEHVGIYDRFSAVVCGDQVTHGKPAPDLFLEAARQINMPPERCVVLEDSEAGIQAASAAGMLSLMVPDLKQPEPEIAALAYRVLPSLHEAIPLLECFLTNGLPRQSGKDQERF